MIDSLAPQMAATLKEDKQWEVPDVPLEDIPDNNYAHYFKQTRYEHCDE